MYTSVITCTTRPREVSCVLASTYLLILLYNQPSSDSLLQCSRTEGCTDIYKGKRERGGRESEREKEREREREREIGSERERNKEREGARERGRESEGEC